MKTKRTLFWATVVALVVLFTAPAAFAGDQDFVLHNQTGVEIHALLVTPHDSNDWGDDILGKDTLSDGDSIEIKFHRKEKSKMWDVRIEDAEGNSVEWENLNLLEISEVTLHCSKKCTKVWADTN